MLCPQCRAENNAGRRFCAACGASLAPTCPACSFANEFDAKFCGGCGRALAMPPGPAYPQPPAYLAARILRARDTLEGERKQVTVLLTDLRGSLELLSGRDPEDARALLDPVLERMIDAVHRYEGTVNQIMGDGIMALFGAPIAHEDHAVRAGYAALRMQASIRDLAEQIQRKHGVAPQIRVGLNSGEVVVRGIGNDLTMDYTAVGETTHLAGRMEQLARPGAILVTETFVRLTEGYLHFKPLGLVAVKGLAEPLEVFELVDAEPIRGRFQAAARGLTRFVGRRSEFVALEEALQRARSGQGQVLAVIGEPGVGKSRLFYEFIDSPSTGGCTILETAAVSYGKLNAYFPLRELLKTFFQIEDRDDTDAVRQKVATKLTDLDKSLGITAPALLALLDVPLEDQTWRELDPGQRRQRMLDGVKRLLIRLSQAQPLIVVFENLHWIDAETQAFLDNLIESLPTAHYLLLVNYRPEYQHGWGSKTYYVQLRLEPLRAESAEELLRVMLGSASELQPLKKLLIERTEGNPFFLEECIHTLIETKVLVGERGALRLGKPLSGIQVPATVQAILAARIDRLSAEDKRVLQCAAMIGKDVSFPLLQAVATTPEAELRQSLAQLQSAEFLYEGSLFPELEYTFKHVLTQDVAYASLLLERRRELHARIVHALETLHADRPPDIDRLAHHAFRGALWEKAVAYFRQAGTKAMSTAYREAVAYFEQALVALDHLPENRETMGQAVDLRFQLQSALHQLGDVDRMVTNLRAAETVAALLGDQRWLGRIAAQMTYCYRFTADLDRARDSGERAHAIALTLGDTRFEVLTNYRLSQVDMVQGRYRRVVDLNRRNLEILGGESGLEGVGTAVSSAISSRQILGWSLMALGETSEAILVLEEGVRLSETVTHEFSRGFAYWGLGGGLALKGHFSEAIPWLERSLILFRRENVAYMIALAANWLGWTYTLCGRGTEGQPLLEEAASRLAAMRFQVHIPINTLLLGEAAVLGGRLQRAMAYAQQTLELSQAHGQRPTQAGALRLIGDVHASTDLAAAPLAEAAYRESLAMAENLEARPLAARCHLGLGQLNRRAHRHDQARQHLTIAATMLREMDIAFWLEKAENELVGLG